MKLNPILKNISEAELIKESTSDITWYVRIGGDDNNDGLSVGNAFATIGKALSEVYKTRVIKHTFIIDIGAGTFNDPINPNGLFFTKAGQLIIQGNLVLATLATGNNTGTFTGGDDYIGIDSGQSWTSNDLRGKIVNVDTNDFYVMKKNDATSLTIPSREVGGFSGKAYNIYESDTILDVSGSGSIINVHNIKGPNNCLIIKNFKINNTASMIGAYVEFSDYVQLENLHLIDPYFLGMIIQNNNFISLKNIYIQNNISAFNFGGGSINSIVRMACNGIVIDGAGGSDDWACINFDNIGSLGSLAISVDGNSDGPGIILSNINSVSLLGNNIESSNNTTHGVIVKNGTNVIENYNWYSGSGNGGHGIFVRDKSRIVIEDGINITGTNGDLKLGKFTISWSEFASNGDVRTDSTYLSTVERID